MNENKNDWDECLDKILFPLKFKKVLNVHHFFII